MDTRAIARIEVAQNGQKINRGTAFLVTPDLVLTAYHALDWMFGYGNVTSFGQIRRFIRHGRLVDATGADVYLPNVARLRAHIVLLQGNDNELFLPEGSAATLEWLVTHHGPGACTRVVVPDYAHLDCFIGRDAARDVFSLVLAQLEAFN
jgi:cholesterol oxidase